MGLRATIVEGLGPALDFVYPPRCPSCGDAVLSQTGLCPPCWDALEVPGEPACRTCQKVLSPRRAGTGDQCFECIAQLPRHSGIFAATIYNDASRKLVLRFKHGGKIALAPLLAKLMHGRLMLNELDDPCFVPVPLHRWRIWSRGFNQSALLARELARLGGGEVAVDALVRHRRTPSLGGLNGNARRKALDGAIRPRTGAVKQIAGRDVVLVDDVLTSGATSAACVGALMDAGANSVRICCFARVMDAV